MSDAFIIGEDWISEHFFTTDAKSQSFGAEVLSRRKEWDSLADEGLPNVRQAVIGVRERLVRALALLDDVRSGRLCMSRSVKHWGSRVSELQSSFPGPSGC